MNWPLFTEAARAALIADRRAHLWAACIATLAADDRAGALSEAVAIAARLEQFRCLDCWREIVRSTEASIAAGNPLENT